MDNSVKEITVYQVQTPYIIPTPLHSPTPPENGKASNRPSVNHIPSTVDSSDGPGPTTSDTASLSGSLSCSDLKEIIN